METVKEKIDPNIEKENFENYKNLVEEIKSKNEIVKNLAKKNGEKSYNAIKIPPYKKKLNIERNDLCPCGSGKKFKKCCGEFL